MKGDLTRSTFHREQHYTGVRMQQGRVLLDAEANEQVDIQNYLRETVTRDVVGRTGAPRDGGGFRIGWTGADIVISAGRMYVDGILCENEGTIAAVDPAHPAQPSTLTLLNWGTQIQTNAWVELTGVATTGGPLTEFHQITGINAGAGTVTFAPLTNFDKVVELHTTIKISEQTDNPGFAPLVGNSHLVYLDVWQRHITALDDHTIREVALNGIETTTRSKTLWQVRDEALVACTSFHKDRSGALLQARTAAAAAPATPCEIPQSAGYRRLENQLYRIEIHDAHLNAANATFKWSRDNGSIVFPIEAAAGADGLQLGSTGFDDRTSLHVNDWVELINDVLDLQGQPGQILRVATPPQSSDRIVKFTTNVGAIDLTKRARLRVWADPSVAAAVRTLTAGADVDGYVAIEDGIQVRFTGTNFKTGDYWLIPARTAINQETGSIEWPIVSAQPVALPPAGITHHYAPLAEISAGVVEDCRPIFSPITAPDLFYDGGDGQEVMPDVNNLANEVALPLPLRAGVSNGIAVGHATVRFKINAPNGGTLVGPSSSGTQVDVQTNADGIASCAWHVNSRDLTQTVTATLVALDAPGFVPGLPAIVYNAHLSVASNVAYTPGCDYLAGKKVTNVKDAIDELCKRRSGAGVCTLVLGPEDDVVKLIAEASQKENRLEICFRTGVFEIEELITFKGTRTVKITGGGPAGTVIKSPLNTVFQFVKCQSVLMRDLSVDVGEEKTLLDSEGAIQAIGCGRFVLEQIEVAPAIDLVDSTRARILVENCDWVSISGCGLSVPVGQIGILVRHSFETLIAECFINAPLRDQGRPIDTVRAKLIHELVVGTPSPEAARANVNLKIGRLPVSFVSPMSTDDWNRVLAFVDTKKIKTEDDVRRVMDSAVEALFSNEDALAAGGDAAKRIIGEITAAVHLVTTAGIVVTGDTDTVTIRNNRIVNMTQGIQVSADRTRRALITGNNILVATSTGQDNIVTAGIAIGNCGSFLIEGNYLIGNVTPNGDVGVTIGGELGTFAIVRDNHFARLQFAVFERVKTALEVKQWRIVANMGDDITGSPAYNSRKFILENNVP